MPEHLGLPDPLRSPTRRAAGGGGRIPVRESRAEHAAHLTQGLEAIPVRPSELDSVDPDLVFKFNSASRLSEGLLQNLGIDVLGDNEDWTYFVLLDAQAVEAFLGAVDAFAQLDAQGHVDISAGLRDAIQTIDDIEPYGPDDRISPELATQDSSDVVEVHVRLWPSQDVAEAGRRVNRVAQLIDTTEGCELLATTDGPQTSAVIANVTQEGLALLADMSVVEKIKPPLEVPVTLSDLDTVDIGDVEDPEGVPIGVLDDGFVSTNPLMNGVVAGTSSFPDDSIYTWNPAGRHGMGVASLAAFYDFESFVRDGESLSSPHPIYMARVMEPTPAPSAGASTRPAYGHVFHVSVEEAIRWLHSQGVRIISMSISYRCAAPEGAPRDELSYVLDSLARELDLVIVLTSGNSTPVGDHIHGHHVAHDYPGYLATADAGIAEPGLAAIALTVGGEARWEASAWPSYVGIAPAGGVSPFSRTGANAGNGRMKPDLVHWSGGWSWSNSLNQLAMSDPSLASVVASITPGQSLDINFGTSFATPRVAHIAAEVLTRYPNASANLIRALLLISARPSTAVLNEFVSSGERFKVCGSGRPDIASAISCGGYRVVLMYEGDIECDTTVVHPVPIPVEYTVGRRPRRIRVAVACDPPVRRTRREYIAGHLQMAMLRATTEPEALEIFRRQPSARARQVDPSLSATQLPRNRRRLTFRPGPNEVARSATYVADFSTRQLLEDDGDTYYLAVTHQKSPWSNLDGYQRQRYAVAVELLDEGEAESTVDLYSLVKARVQARIRPRLRRR
jgi:hypothetical protein